MTDQEYNDLKREAQDIIAALQTFPARAFLEEARRRGEGEFGLIVWATHLETIPDPIPTPGSDLSKPTG